MFERLKKFLHVEQTTKREKLISAFIFFGFIFLAGYGGSVMNGKEMGFYDALTKPAAAPPSWIFPFIWTAIFVLIGLAGYYIWNFYESEKYRKLFVGLYAVNGVLIYLWPQLFFVKESLAGALYTIVGLLIVAEIMILVAFKTNHKAAYLLMPYLGWLLFAAYLNISILTLNA